MSDKDKILIGYKGVKYGLQKQQVASVPKPAAFGGESSDEEAVSEQVAREQEKNLKASRIAAAHEAALAEDSTVFEYDTVYEDIQKSRVDPKKQDLVDRRPKYIQQLVQKAEIRKKEQDVAYERRLLKERKADDHLYEEKEAFLTEAYKNKLMEDKYWIHREKLMDVVEEKQDVTKKKDLTGFYQNLCRNNVAFASNSFKDPEAAKPEPTPLPRKLQEIVDQRVDIPEISNAASETPPTHTQDSIKEKEAQSVEAPSPAPIEKKRRRRNDEESIKSARERYLARKQAQQDL